MRRWLQHLRGTRNIEIDTSMSIPVPDNNFFTPQPPSSPRSTYSSDCSSSYFQPQSPAYPNLVLYPENDGMDIDSSANSASPTSPTDQSYSRSNSYPSLSNVGLITPMSLNPEAHHRWVSLRTMEITFSVFSTFPFVLCVLNWSLTIVHFSVLFRRLFSCTQIPRLKIAASPGLGGQRAMYVHCDECGAISIAPLNAS